MRRSPRSRRPSRKPTAFDRETAFAIVLVAAVPLVTLFALRAIAASAPASAHLWLREATAAIASWAVRAVGVPVTLARGTELVLRNHVLRIDLACTAIDWLVLFAVAVAVVPVLLRRRISAILVGLPTIAVLNVVRLVAVALVSEYSPRQFAFVHGVVLQFSIAALVSLMWVAFLWRSRDDWSPEWS